MFTKNHFVRSELAAISPKIEANTQPMDELAQSVSYVNIPSNDSPQSQAHDLGSQVKLLKLVLKKFNGDISRWCSFWDTFEAEIHKNSKLLTVDKFYYLNSLQEKTASEAIASLAITNAVYEEATAILKTIFLNKHMDDFINMAHVYSSYDLRGLRQLYDLVEVHVRGLKALGVPSEFYGSLLSSVLMNKVPQEVSLIISREVRGRGWELDPLLAVMHQELEARERATQGNHNPRPDPPFRRNKPH